MDQDRIEGAHEVKGSVKEVIGETAGDAKLQADGKTGRKVQNALGGMKDTLRNMVKK